MEVNSDHEEEESMTFNDIGLDCRILEAVAKLGWKTPTLIQTKAIPLFLKGRNILASARTGSGKTASYLIPLIHGLLENKSSASTHDVRALILAPTRELCKQINEHINSLTTSCRKAVTSVDLSALDPQLSTKVLVTNNPDIVVGTPLKVLSHLENGHFECKDSLQYLIIDEADLMFTFNNQEDLNNIISKLPSVYQCFITSALMPDDVKGLKRLLRSPVVLKLEEPPLPIGAQLTQYVVKMEPLDKAILLIALFKLNMMRGRTIIFANNIDRCYKLHLFLDMFGLKSCVLNSKLPVNSRCHIIDQVNKGKYKIIIAADVPEDDEKRLSSRKKKPQKSEGEREYSVSRGIDFQFISNVVNFDFPPDVTMYIHRVGRTARASMKGTALSLVSAKEMKTFENVEVDLKKYMPGCDCVFKEYTFNMASLDGFRYRANDAWGKCTKFAVRNCRKKEIQRELLNSKKLESFYAANPQDLEALRHDIATKTVVAPAHLSHVPSYNVPKALRRITASKKRKEKLKIRETAVSRSAKDYQMRQKDPLRSLKFSGFKKKK